VVHEHVRKHLVSGWAPGEWEAVGVDHPVAKLYRAGRQNEGDRLLREYTAAHEAGHAVLGLLVGLDVREVVVAHLHEIVDAHVAGAAGGGSTLGYIVYQHPTGAPPDPVASALHCLAGIAGHGLVYGDEWGLGAAAWTAPAALGALRGEPNGPGRPGAAGGDAWEARAIIRPVILSGRRFLGQSTTGGAMVAALEQAEALLLARRGALLRLAGHLVNYGRADRATIGALMEVPE
jgi:hypothetical protein